MITPGRARHEANAHLTPGTITSRDAVVSVTKPIGTTNQVAHGAAMPAWARPVGAARLADARRGVQRLLVEA